MLRIIFSTCILLVFYSSSAKDYFIPDPKLREKIFGFAEECIDEDGFLDTLCAASGMYQYIDLQELDVLNYDGLQFFKSAIYVQAVYGGEDPNAAINNNLNEYAPSSIVFFDLSIGKSITLQENMIPSSAVSVQVSRPSFSSLADEKLELGVLPASLKGLNLVNFVYPFYFGFHPFEIRINAALPEFLETLQLIEVDLVIADGVEPPGNLTKLNVNSSKLGAWCSKPELYQTVRELEFLGNGYRIASENCLPYFFENLQQLNVGFVNDPVLKERFVEGIHKSEILERCTLKYVEGFEFDFNELFPRSLLELNIEFSQLPIVKNLPDGIQKLVLQKTGTLDLHDGNLPAELDELILRDMSMLFVRDLPEALRRAELAGMTVSDWKATALPRSLEELYILSSRIDTLDLQTPPLKVLVFDNNLIKHVASLPDSIDYLALGNQGQLREIAADLRDLSISTLRFSGLGIVTMPGLPTQLDSLYLVGNGALRCMTPLPSALRFIETQFGCIPNETDFITAGIVYPLCPGPNFLRCPEEDPEYRGRLFLDINGNNIFDANDKPFPFRSFYIEQNKQYVTTAADGTFSFSVAPYVNYSINFYAEDLPRCYPNINIFQFAPDFSGFSGDSLAITYTPLEGSDLEVLATSSAPVVGESMDVHIFLLGRGRPTPGSAIVSLSFPEGWEVEATSSGSDFQSNLIRWQNVNPIEYGMLVFSAKLKVPSDFSNGQKFDLIASVSAFPDTYQENNQFIISNTVVVEKPELRKTVDKELVVVPLTQSQALLYSIYYQNSTSDTVRGLVVTDSFSQQLFVSWCRLVHSSHLLDFKMEQGGIGVFNFGDIVIPPASVDEAGSKVQVVFQVYAPFNLPVGTLITNTAKAEIENNLVRSTNTVSTRWVALTNTLEAKVNLFEVFPNPSSEDFIIRAIDDTHAFVAVYDLSGKLWTEFQMTSNTAKVRVQDWPKGVYIVVLKAEEETSVQRVVVQ
jgi:hypothetical protein